MVKEKLILFCAPLLTTTVRRLIGKVAIELVTTARVGFVKFLMPKLQRWSKIHIVGEYQELHVRPAYVKAVV